MSDFDRQLIPIYEAVRREKIRCICIVACVVIVLASALGAMFYCIPPPMMGAACEPVTYSYTDAAGTTTTTTIKSGSTITTVTTAEGKFVSTSITSGRVRNI